MKHTTVPHCAALYRTVLHCTDLIHHVRRAPCLLSAPHPHLPKTHPSIISIVAQVIIYTKPLYTFVLCIFFCTWGCSTAHMVPQSTADPGISAVPQSVASYGSFLASIGNFFPPWGGLTDDATGLPTYNRRLNTQTGFAWLSSGWN